MSFFSEVLSSGSYLPKRVIKNEELALKIDTSDQWIQERTGIKQRHIVEENEFTSDLGTKAGQIALQKANVTAEDIDCIVVATTTADHTFPACAARIQANLGAVKAMAFDIQAVCSGFIYALAVADNFIRLGQCKRALVIGAESMSRLLNWQDRTTCVLFGDGAGAVVLQATSKEDSTHLQKGILSTHLFSDGRGYDWLYTEPNNQGKGYIRMNGREIFKSAVDKIGQAVQAALDYNQIRSQDIDWFVPHQANQRIIQGVCDRFSIPLEKMVLTIDSQANTSAASIPLALDTAVKDGRIKKGQLILLEAMGGGLTWASALIRW